MSDEDLYPPVMGEQDAMFWNLERYASMRSTIVAVSLLDRIPDRALTRKKLAAATRRIPRLRQRVVPLFRWNSTPAWETVDHFDLDYHVRWVGAPGKRTVDEVIDLAATIAMQAFDYERPLWEFIIVEGVDNERAAVIQKFHHSVVDGAAGVRLMLEFYDLDRDTPVEVNSLEPEPEPEPEPERERETPERGRLELEWSALKRRALARPSKLIKQVGRSVTRLASPIETIRNDLSDLRSLADLFTPGPGPLSPIMQSRSQNLRFGSIDVRLDALKSAARAADCKLNDAFLAGIGGGWRRYHQLHGHDVEELQISFPINLRASGGTGLAGNNVAVARCCLPISETDPKKRMRTVREHVMKHKDQPSTEIMDGLAASVNRLPSVMIHQFASRAARTNDYVASCVPGLSAPLYMAGSEIQSLYTFGPLAGSAANFTLFSYTDHANVAVAMDPAAIPDPVELIRCMREGFDEVLKTG